MALEHTDNNFTDWANIKLPTVFLQTFCAEMDVNWAIVKVLEKQQ